jgi:hypothetical protein
VQGDTGDTGADGNDGADGLDADLSVGSDTDVDGVLFGDGSQLSAATASEIRIAADLDTTNSPTFDSLTLTGDISLAAGASVTSAGTLTLGADGDTLEFSGGFGGIKLNGSDQFAFQKLGSTELVIGGASGHQSNRGIFPSGGAHDLGLNGNRWGTAYLSDIDASGDIILSDGATIDVGGGSGLLDLDGTLKVDEGISLPSATPLVFNGATNINATSTYSIIKSGARLEFRTTNTYPFFAVSHFTAVIGATSTLSFSNSASAAGTRDVALSRASAGHLQLGNGTVNDTSGTLSLSDLIATGDITLSDGAIIDVGSGTGDLTIDADFVSIPNAKLSLGSSGKLQFSAATDQGNAYSLRKSGVRIYAHGNLNNDAAFMYTFSKFHFHSTMVLGWGSGNGAGDSVDIGFSRGGSGHLKLGNGTQNDASGKLEVSDLVAAGNVDFSGLPTSDPAVAGRLWNDSGTLKISAG